MLKTSLVLRHATPGWRNKVIIGGIILFSLAQQESPLYAEEMVNQLIVSIQD